MKTDTQEIAEAAWQEAALSADQLVDEYNSWLDGCDEQQSLLTADSEREWDEDDIDSDVRNRLRAEQVDFSDVATDYETLTQEFDADIHLLQASIERLKHAVNIQNKEDLIECIGVMSRLSEDFNIDFYQSLNELLTYVDQLSVEEAQLIYVPEKPHIIVPDLVVPAYEDLIKRIKRSPSILFSITPRAFEELIAEIFDKQGFRVQLTKRTRDGGMDIIAIQSSLGIDAKYIIECKRYAKERKVTLDLVQRLYGVKMSERANKAILVTSSGFTQDAIRFARQHIWDLALKDCDAVLRWIREY